MPKKTILLLSCGLAFLSAAARLAAIDAKLENDSPEGLAVRANLQPAALGNAPVKLRLELTGGSHADHAEVTLTAEDIFGQPIDWQAGESVPLGPDGKAVKDFVFPPPGPGYFRVRARVVAGEESAEASTDFGVAAPPHPGLRPDSFFASNTASFKQGAELDLLAAIGMKVERLSFYPKPLKDPAAVPSGEAVPMDFTAVDKSWADARAHGLWMLPIICYALPKDNSPLADQLGMYGPPRDNARYAATWAGIMKHYPEITAVEFWNEPWIFGWTFAGTPVDYRATQQATCAALLQANPHLRIVAGSSTPFVVDNIEPDPASWQGLLAGISQHPYTTSVSEANLRAGDQMRFQDETPLVARRMHLPYAYVTEGGTFYSSEGQKTTALTSELQALTPDEKAGPRGKELQAQIKRLGQDQEQYNNLENAGKVVQYYVQSALAGVFQGNAQWQIGYGAGWTRANTAFAVMTHFLEDRPVVADIWPANELIWGGIFANPKFVTAEVKALPRAGELAARWGVPIPADRADDQTKVAVIWSLTGQSNQRLDQKGTITLEAAPDLRAYDLTGREIPSTAGKLVLPFTAAPVYVTSDALSAVELRGRIAGGEIRQVTPVNCYALSLLADPGQAQSLPVRLENQLNVPVRGTLKLKIKDSGREISAPFALEASRLAEIQLPWPGVAASPNNQYAVTLSAEVSSAASSSPPGAMPVVVSHDQLLAGAAFVKRTIPLAGNLAAWQGIPPVLLDSDLLSSDANLSQYLQNPGLEKPTGSAGKKRIVARVYTAYDEANVYLAAEVNEDTHHCAAGEPAVKGRKAEKVTLPYKNGLPGGLNHAVFAGDVFQFAFGFRDRVPGVGRQMDDPYAWKGAFYDTDYDYVAHTSTAGDQLIRLWGPRTERRNGYQTEAVPGQEPVPGGRIRITRDEDRKVTLYELSIPRAELTLFDPAAGRCRFGFVLYNSEGLGSGNALTWSDAAGVFDHWRNFGSFAPTWAQRTACQTFFGIQ